MFVVLLGVDIGLRHVARSRAVILGTALAPAMLVALIALASSNWSALAVGYVAWLLVVGRLFGLVARLPRRAVAD